MNERIDKYVLGETEVCCGQRPTTYTASGLAWKVKCKECGEQTGLEICSGDAIEAWNELFEQKAGGEL